MHRDRHSRRFGFNRFPDSAGISGRQFSRIITVAAAGVADFRVAEVGERDVIELQVGAPCFRERRYRSAVGRGGVAPEFLHVGVRNAGAPGAKMQH
jgi:hypothetical protein